MNKHLYRFMLGACEVQELVFWRIQVKITVWSYSRVYIIYFSHVFVLKFKSTLSFLMWLGLALSIALNPLHFLLFEKFDIRDLAVHVHVFLLQKVWLVGLSICRVFQPSLERLKFSDLVDEILSFVVCQSVHFVPPLLLQVAALPIQHSGFYLG